MTRTDDRLVSTRAALHRVAEHVLAAAQFRDGAGIRLHYVPGGFETLRGLADGRRLAVVDGEFVVIEPDGRRRATALTTVAAVAEFAGVEPGLPAGTYQAATVSDPGAPLDVDKATARMLAEWYGTSDEALRQLARELDDGAQEPVLWPEHFDIGITVDAVNYGASPGDDAVTEPYLYVGPHAGPPRRDDFWNASFGAVLRRSEVDSVADALAFFRHGRGQTSGAG